MNTTITHHTSKNSQGTPYNIPAKTATSNSHPVEGQMSYSMFSCFTVLLPQVPLSAKMSLLVERAEISPTYRCREPRVITAAPKLQTGEYSAVHLPATTDINSFISSLREATWGQSRYWSQEEISQRISHKRSRNDEKNYRLEHKDICHN